MNKRILVIFMVITTLCCLFVTSSVTALADDGGTEIVTETNTPESTLPTPEDVVDKMTNSDLFSEEDRQLIKDLVAKVESYTENSDSFFIRVIVPIIVAGALVLIFGIILLLPLFRSKGETKTVKAMFENSKKQIEEYKKQIEEYKAMVNTDTIKTDIKTFMGEELKTLGLILETELNKENVELGKIEAILLSLINGAINAWKASPEAVDKLTQIATSEELKNITDENAKLKAYILRTGGENALKEVNL